MSSNKIKYGLKNVYYAKASFDEDGNVEYSTPEKIPGAVSLSLDPEGETEPWYAENGILFTAYNNNEGYSGQLEVAILPERFRISILNEEVDRERVMSEVSDARLSHFALLFQFEGDVRETRHVLYNCICSRTPIESGTATATKEPQTDTLSFVAGALPCGYVKAKTLQDVSSGIYDAWFDKVYEPGTAQYEKGFAVYSEDDRSLVFYADDYVPSVGNKFGGKTVTAVFLGLEDTRTGGNYSSIPWYPYREQIESVSFDPAFKMFKPLSFAWWFYEFTNCKKIDLSNLNASECLNTYEMFYNCRQITSLDVSNLDVSKVVNMYGMFRYCYALETIYSDDDVFVTDLVSSGNYVFDGCNALVGGNGSTVAACGDTSYKMAHVDTAENPGYFTAKK